MPQVPPTILPNSLVATDWLTGHLDHPGLRIVDIRGYVTTTDLGGGRQWAEYVGARSEYDAGHIPGAVYVDWTTDITNPDSPIKAQIAPPARFARAMSERGIGGDSDVVVVDHTGGHFATRLWWALRYHGHDRVAVLDGGYTKWTAEGRPVTTQVPAPSPTVFTPRVRPELRVDVQNVAAMIGDPAVVIVDARDPAQYRGDVVRGSRGGHIPGAVSIPAKTLVEESGVWKPLAGQRRMFEAAGVLDGRPIVAYCNGGVTATALLFALDRLGHRSYANYDGSWNEWGERPELPVVEGSKPG